MSFISGQSRIAASPMHGTMAAFPMKPKRPLPADIEALVEEEVQRRLASAMAVQQEQFATAMQAAMQGALGGVDRANVALAEERAALLEDRDAVRALHAKAEREGEAMAQEAYGKHRLQYDEAARLGLLRTLVRRQVEAGKATPEIAGWFMVEPAFVEAIRRVVKGVHKLRRSEGKRITPPGARVLFRDQGRSGTIIYESPDTRFDLWWEMGSTALALVDVPTEEQWTERTGLPLLRRHEVLTFIGGEIVATQAPGGGSFIIGDNVLTIYAD